MEEPTLFRVARMDERNVLVDIQGYYYENKIADEYSPGDIIQISNGQVHLLYDGVEHYGTIFITNHCNSNCIMCPDSDKFRSLKSGYNLQHILDFIALLSDDEIEGMDITGGEPTLITYDLPVILKAVYKKGFHIPVMLLSNGRSFADRKYTSLFQPFAKQGFYVEIPIHGSTVQLHEEITRGVGGFRQTMAGIHNLIQNGIMVGIRTVVTKLNYNDLKNIIHLVHEEFPEILYINIMGMECLGNAYANRDKVWIEFEKSKEVIEEAAEECVRLGIEPRLYNFPLCLFQEKFWGCYRKSITPGKVRYKEECKGCRLKSECGGFFHSTIHITDFKPERRV